MQQPSNPRAILAQTLTLVALVAVACGPMPGDDQEKYAATDAETAEAVVDEVLTRLGTEYAERGPEFVKRVPEVKREVAVAKGFRDWREFSERVRLLSPERDLWVTSRITERMEELLATPYEPPKPKEPEEDEE